MISLPPFALNVLRLVEIASFIAAVSKVFGVSLSKSKFIVSKFGYAGVKK